MLSLRVIDKASTLNNFSFKSSITFAGGETVTLRLVLWQADKQIRYIPASGAVITLDLRKSDETVITKTATQPFADDRSVIEISLTSVESAAIISQNLAATITESGSTTIAVLENAIQKVVLTGGC